MIRILFIDSKLTFLKKLNHFIHQPKYEFIFVENSIEGLECFQKKQIDAVISHLGNNGDLDDFELMLNVKEIKPNVPVIIVLSNNSEAKPEYLLKAGAFACFTETVSANEIMRSIENSLS